MEGFSQLKSANERGGASRRTAPLLDRQSPVLSLLRAVVVPVVPVFLAAPGSLQPLEVSVRYVVVVVVYFASSSLGCSGLSKEHRTC